MENWGHADLAKTVHHRAEGRRRRRPDRQRGHHRLVRAAVDGGEVPGHHRLEEPEQVRLDCSRRPSPAARASSSTATRLRHQRRGPGEEPQPGLQGGVLRHRGRPDPVVPDGASRTRRRCSATSTSRSGSSPRCRSRRSICRRRPTGLRRRPGEGRLRLPAVHLEQDHLQEVRRQRSPAAKLVKNFKWTNEDQNAVATDIQGGMTPEAAAKKWVDANQQVVDSWLKVNSTAPRQESHPPREIHGWVTCFPQAAVSRWRRWVISSTRRDMREPTWRRPPGQLEASRESSRALAKAQERE